jgi:predicted ATP-dependent endonuclease of OLD family
MKIFKVQVESYRLLKAFSIDLEPTLSLVVGKNNTGKTSLLKVLEKFLGPPENAKFSLDDFNMDFKQQLKALIEDSAIIEVNDFKPIGIKMRLFIRYHEHDNLANISRVMMDLDPDNNVIVLGFEYSLNHQDYLRIKHDYAEFVTKESGKKKEKQEYKAQGLFEFLSEEQAKYFKIRKTSIQYNPATGTLVENNYIPIDESIPVRDIVNFRSISARRDVTNREVDNTLSGQTSRIYKATEKNAEQNKAVENFKDQLSETDTQLTGIYKNLFDGIILKIRSFGGVKLNESEIEIISTLKHRELLAGNTTVVYKHDSNHSLPEHYNGLGYMNLISMIFEIEILVHEFKRENEKKPADINLLFIEEPEAHTHPQMQYIFIKNIKSLLKDGIKRDDGEDRELQYLISTHSSCIVADSDFEDIKYLKKQSSNGVIAKNLSDLQKEYDKNSPQYLFLKQYLTISRAEIFFAEKAVLIEGDTERILIPTMMRKLDMEESSKHAAAKTVDHSLPLLSQNISVIEVGAYSKIFEIFIDFLGIKSLIITDIDTVGADGRACPVAVGANFSNASLSFFLSNPTLTQLKGYNLQNKLLHKTGGNWTVNASGHLCIVYQTDDNGYHGRSFEDAFIHINHAFVNANKATFEGLKNKTDFDDQSKSPYDLAGNCIIKKTHFALDILYHSNSNLDNWQIPQYIKEGLLWLKKD